MQVARQATEWMRQAAAGDPRARQQLAEAQQRVREVLAAQPRVELIHDEPGYLHAVFRSPTMGFPDDVEFLFDEAAGLIHFRSASRLGRGDLGVNRARIEEIRRLLEITRGRTTATPTAG